MTKLSDYAILLIGFSFSFLLINKIAFGVSLILGIVILIFFNLEIIVNQTKRIFKKISKYEVLITFFFLFLFFISAFLSIKPYRSFLVIIYLNLFMIFSFFTFLILLKNKKKAIFLFKILSISFAANALLIFIYNVLNYEIDEELIKFKGFVNLMTIFAVINFFLIKSKLNYITIFLLIPNIIMSGSSASILGIIIGICLCSLFYLLTKLHILYKLRYFLLTISLSISIISSFLFYKNLPRIFDQKSIANFEFKIPTNLIDHHRQFIWGFSIQKFKIKPLFGYGQDSSNFIDGSQVDIGSKYTGDMNFIPSHPHNFLIEILLETGIFGTLSFILLIYLINLRIWKLNHSFRFKLCLIFLNSFFWGSSLVNFSFWLGWWQASYFLLLSLIASRGVIDKKEKKKPIFLV